MCLFAVLYVDCRGPVFVDLCIPLDFYPLGKTDIFFVLDFPIGRLNRNDELDVDCFLGKNLLMDGRTIRQAGQHLASRIR